ncbi:MAG: Crp/Fnr family transcriptional regulator [Bacteroidota bacterium]
MKEYAPLIDVIRNEISLSETEEIALASAFNLLSVSRGELLLQSGTIPQTLYFISSGFVRCFDVDTAGNEITTNISTSNDFITSFESFVKVIPAKESIQCISDCILLCVSKHEYDKLYDHVAGWSDFCQTVYENYIIKLTNRVNGLQNLSATDRYIQLLNTHPDVALNTAVKQLASYLGIRPQSLSRIRKNIK